MLPPHRTQPIADTGNRGMGLVIPAFHALSGDTMIREKVIQPISEPSDMGHMRMPPHLSRLRDLAAAYSYSPFAFSLEKPGNLSNRLWS